MANNSTRQMLDDLDSLMERMLALPMEEPEQELSSPAPPIKRPALAATLTVLPELDVDAKAPTLQGPHVRFSEPVVPVPKSPEPVAPRLEPVVQPKPAVSEIPPPLVIRRLDKQPEIPEPPAPVRPSRLWSPLLWINQTFDQATRLLGPIGWLLRTPPGRLLLGVAGLVLLGLAAAWLAQDVITWTP